MICVAGDDLEEEMALLVLRKARRASRIVPTLLERSLVFVVSKCGLCSSGSENVLEELMAHPLKQSGVGPLLCTCR